MAVGSSSSSLPIDVFLNFRGEDTRRSFVCHLHAALERQAVKAYIDSEDLRKGNKLSDLLTAIANSKLSIVVFSQNYASSTWCLKELVEILKRKAEQNQIVMPVFYQVDPSHVRKQEESFAQAFAQHERDRNNDLQEVQSWRSALIEATNISGWDSRKYKDDAKLIDEIVDHVFTEWIHISSSKNNHLVGMDSHLQKMRQLLRLEMDDDVVKVGIWGMGGIGKTTIATEVYNEIRDQFDHYFFLHDVREGFRNGNVSMQKKLICGLLNKEVRIDILNDGYKIMESLSKKKVLVVLDDVDNSDQIETLVGLGPEPSFGVGSRIVITTRNSGILNGFEIYEAELLSDGDADKLFRQYAFKSNKPSGEYDQLSRRAVEYAQGLPLALKVLGAFLDNRSASEWEDELEKLKKFPYSRIQNVLRTSYDGLDDSQKNIFLDIACFFRGYLESDLVTKVLDSCGFFPHIGLKVLVDRALVTISNSDTLEMHDLLQEMGREIESTKEPGKQSRLWSYADVERVLTQNTATEAVEGLMDDLLTSEEIYLNAEAFVRMTKLRLIIFTNWNRYHCKNHVNGDLQHLSHELRVLVWYRCPLKSLPSNFNPKNLIYLDMHRSHLEQLWKGIKPVKKLIIIDLRYCEYLSTIPDLTEATNLEELDLRGCISLSEVHPSIAGLTNLVFLSLKQCIEIKSLPSIIHMKSLTTLVLSGCSKLDKFPDISETMEALSELDLDETAIEELPSSIERLQRLESLSMKNCTSLVCLPESICNLADLAFLDLSGCSKLHNLPENLGNLESLWELEVQQTGIKQLPVSILHLKLGRLSFNECKQMEAPLSSWPSSIEGRCTVVVHIDLSDCNLLELSDAIAYFSSLKILRLTRNNLESLPAIMNRLVCLEQLDLEGCKRLKSIPELSSSISYINAHDCTALETVSTPKRPYDMGRCFTFSNCSQLVQKDLFRDIVETHSPPQGNHSRPFYMSCPGSEIPERFIHQCGGSSVTAPLPPNWFDNKCLGFTICAVTNKPQAVHYGRCFCTFKGNHCEYRFSFYLFEGDFDSVYCRWLESNHMFLAYVPWSEFGINGEEINKRCYTEAKFEIDDDLYPDLKRCGVRFFFANHEEVAHQDFGELVDNSERSLEGCSAEPSGSDISDEDQYLKLSELFGGENRNSRECDHMSDCEIEDMSDESDWETEDWSDESDCEIEDNDSSGKRKILSRWTQQVRVTSGLMQGPLDDGFSWNCSWKRSWKGVPETEYLRSKYACSHEPRCYAKSKLRISVDDPTIIEITYIGRHTCWKTMPMLTHQVRVTPDMGLDHDGPSDSFSWGKYGQMDILGAKNPRVYYVCIPQNVECCMAIKEVQLSDDDPTILKITYRGRHTCTQASTINTGGRGDSKISEGGGALRIHDQVVQSLTSLVANGGGGNVIRLADKAVDDSNVNMLPKASSLDMEHFQNVNDMANNDMAVYGVASEGTSAVVMNQLQEQNPTVKLTFLVRLGNCCCSSIFLNCFGLTNI